jgi:hypothetical protein
MPAVVVIFLIRTSSVPIPSPETPQRIRNSDRSLPCSVQVCLEANSLKFIYDLYLFLKDRIEKILKNIPKNVQKINALKKQAHLALKYTCT